MSRRGKPDHPAANHQRIEETLYNQTVPGALAATGGVGIATGWEMALAVGAILAGVLIMRYAALRKRRATLGGE